MEKQEKVGLSCEISVMMSSHANKWSAKWIWSVETIFLKILKNVIDYFGHLLHTS